MDKLENNRGITLIALVITIIVLLILAGVSIAMISSQDGIPGKATSAKETQKKAADEETVRLALQAAMMNENGEINETELGTELSKLGYKYEDAIVKKDGKSYAVLTDGSMIEGTKISELSLTAGGASENTNVIDEYGNVFVLPKGFKITSDASNVTQGIVIEDVLANDNTSKGNQFVWIPVGDVKKVENNIIKIYSIEIARYVFDDKGNVDNTLTKTKSTEQLKLTSAATKYYIEKENLDTTFVKSVKENHGYYIGRYDAGDSLATANNKPRDSETEGTLVCKAEQQVYNYILKENAKIKSENMYNGKTFKSALINSFAWDTAILFEQTFDDRIKTEDLLPYSKQTSLNKGSLPITTGTSGDKICNIYDMSGNCFEWDTETSNTSTECVARGGIYSNSNYSTKNRRSTSDRAIANGSFRPILYL